MGVELSGQLYRLGLATSRASLPVQFNARVSYSPLCKQGPFVQRFYLIIPQSTNIIQTLLTICLHYIP